MAPSISALFLVVAKAAPHKAVKAASQFGGIVLESSLSKEAKKELPDALHDTHTTVCG